MLGCVLFTNYVGATYYKNGKLSDFCVPLLQWVVRNGGN